VDREPGGFACRLVLEPRSRSGRRIEPEGIGDVRALRPRLGLSQEAFAARFGFSADLTASLRMPGPFERHRLLAIELVPGVLTGARGPLRATGRPIPRRDLAASAA